jgi:hypothetical protein
MSKIVIDDFLDADMNDRMQRYMASSEFPWTYKDGYFVHNFYRDYSFQNDLAFVVDALITKIAPNAIANITAYLYNKNINLLECESEDWNASAIYYVNSCNGKTMFSDNEVKSVANRMVFFDNEIHTTETNCTDEEYRIAIKLKTY